MTFDFTTALAGETVTAVQAVTVELYSGADAGFAAVLNGAPAIAAGAKAVTQGVKAGVANVDYRLKAKVTTSGGRTLTQARILPVRNA